MARNKAKSASIAIASAAQRGATLLGVMAFASTSGGLVAHASPDGGAFYVTICLGDGSPPLSIPFSEEPGQTPDPAPTKQACHSGCGTIERRRGDKFARLR